MTEIVIVALIGFGGSAIGSLCGIIISNKLISYRLDQVEAKLKELGRVYDNTNKLEEDIALLEQENTYFKIRLEKVELQLESRT